MGQGKSSSPAMLVAGGALLLLALIFLANAGVSSMDGATATATVIGALGVPIGLIAAGLRRL